MKKTIRETVKEQLESLFDLQTVRIGRRYEYKAEQLNAASIYTDSEETERISFQPVRLENKVDLKIVYYVKPSGYDLGEDIVDSIVSAADELILPAVQALDGVFDIEITALDIEGDGEADADYLMATRLYTVTYHTTEPS